MCEKSNVVTTATPSLTVDKKHIWLAQSRIYHMDMLFDVKYFTTDIVLTNLTVRYKYFPCYTWKIMNLLLIIIL